MYEKNKKMTFPMHQLISKCYKIAVLSFYFIGVRFLVRSVVHREKTIKHYSKTPNNIKPNDSFRGRTQDCSIM